MSFLSNVTAFFGTQATVPAFHQPPAPWKNPHAPREIVEFDILDALRATAAPSSPTSTSTFKPVPQGLQTRVENRTITDWLQGYGKALWTAGSSRPSNLGYIREKVISFLGGRHTRDGRTISRQFSVMHRYLYTLASARDDHLRQFPGHRGLIVDAAESFQRNAVDRISYGNIENDAAPAFARHLRPLLAQAEQEAQEMQEAQERLATPSSTATGSSETAAEAESTEPKGATAPPAMA